MNKRIKRVIAATIAISAFSAVAPAKYFDLVATKAYASTYGISSLQVNDGSGSNSLQLYSSSSCDSDEEISFSTSRSTYYTETSSNGVNVEFDTDSGYYAKVKRGSSGAYDSGQRIHVADGDTMTLHVYVYDNSTDKQVSSYTIYVKQTSSKSSSSNSSNYDDYQNDDVYLDDIKLSDGDISFSSTKDTYTVNVASSVDQIRVTATPENEDEDTVRINGDTVDNSDDYRKTISLSNGRNEITIRVKDSDNRSRTYTLYVYRGGSTTSSTTSEDNYQDDIYLNDLIFDNNSGEVNINFNPKVTNYNVNVSSACDSVIIKATPEDEDNKVSINGDNVNSKYAKRVNLNDGKNVINVKVDNSNDYSKDDNDYKNRVYTLNVYRGETSSTSTNNSNTDTSKTNQWVMTNGGWQYNDYLGHPLKNQWYYDNGYGKWFFLDSEGYMKTGWTQLGPSWYYFNGDGSMVTGWIIYNGRYYYLDPNGVMQHDAVINGYRLGSDGAWAQ